MSVEIYGNEYRVELGSVVKIDGWAFAEKLTASDWEPAAFRIPTGQTVIESLAVNVELTGRTLQRRAGDYWIRCRVEFVGDCEPSTFASAWMLAR